MKNSLKIFILFFFSVPFVGSLAYNIASLRKKVKTFEICISLSKPIEECFSSLMAAEYRLYGLEGSTLKFSLNFG